MKVRVASMPASLPLNHARQLSANAFIRPSKSVDETVANARRAFEAAERRNAGQ